MVILKMAIAIGRLNIREKGERGDFSGKKSRRIRHDFSYRSFLEKIKVLAKRKGIKIIELNPAFTSVIGMLKYAPQYIISKDVTASYVIARKGLGIKERIPHNYILLLNRLNINELEELKVYVKKEVKNIYLRKRQLKEIDRVKKLLQSSGSKPEELPEPMDGTSFGSCDRSHNLWRVLMEAVVTPLSPDRILSDMSVMKPLLVTGQVESPDKGRKFLLLGARTTEVLKYRLLGNGHFQKMADYKYPSPLCGFVQSG